MLKTILIVDDSAIVLKAEESVFTEAGCKVLLAHSGDEALRLIDSSVDVVLTDIDMPRMTGDRLAKKIHETYPDIPVFGITNMYVASEQRFNSRHFEGLMIKPLQSDMCGWLLKKTKYRRKRRVA